jgi:uncharacterized protein (TIGR03437 family)
MAKEPGQARTFSSARSRLCIWTRLRTSFAMTILVSCSLGALAQSPAPALVHFPTSLPLALDVTQCRLRPGERAILAAPQETVDFIAQAQTRIVTIDDGRGRGLVVSANAASGQVALAAALTAIPGKHAVTITVIGANGESRSVAMNVTLDPMQPVPSGSQRPPVVLLNGWQLPLQGQLSACPTQPAANTFGSLETELLADGVPVVYFFDNCVEDPNGPIEDLGSDLGQALNLIRYDTGTLVPQVDLVTHSMGGLIARSYLAGLQATGSSFTLSPPPSPRVRKFIEIATPNFGSYLAANLAGLATFVKGGPQTDELTPGSAFLWELATWNQGGDDLRGIDALAIIGNAGAVNHTSPNTSDGVVSLTSASLAFSNDQSRTRIVPYCHVNANAVTYLFSLGAFNCNGVGIANVDEAPDTGQIVRSFLAHSPAWMSVGTTPNQDPYLSRDGGIYVGVENYAAQYVNDLTTAQFGGTQLSENSQYAFYYGDFLPAGQGTAQMVSTSLGAWQFARTAFSGTFTPLRLKVGPFISSVTPLLKGVSGNIIASGGPITLGGYGFGSQQCSGCGVWAYPGPVALQVSSWTDQSITAMLPASFTGLVQLLVQEGSSAMEDSINIMAAPALIATPPSIALSTSRISFAYTFGGVLPTPQTVSVSNGGGGALTWSASASSAWVTLAAASGTLTISVNPTGLAVGQYNAAISVTAAGAFNSPQTINVSLGVNAAASTVIVSAITNAASGVSGAIAPGEMVSIFGAGLGPSAGVSFSVDPSTGMVDSTLAGTRVFFGPYAAPITYTSASQINAIVPYEIAGQAQVVMQVEYLSALSAGTTLPIASAAPGVFTFNSTGSGQAAAANQDGSYNGPLTPAPKGSYLTIYFTGGGQTNPAGTTGSVNGNTLKWLAQSIGVTVGGQPATVTFDGAAPTFIDGVGQLNIRLADATPSGPTQPLVVVVGGASSGTAMLAVQ